jgi:hypothetical protein
VVSQRDFDSDGKSDWLWLDQRQCGDVAMWFTDGAQVTESAGVGNVPAVWPIQAPTPIDQAIGLR